MWKTLNQVLSRTVKTILIHDELSADRFNQFFTSVADNLCSIFSGALLPKILIPRLAVDFALQEVDINFVYQELLNLKTKKATGLDEIPARLMKISAQEIAKPITYLINLTITSGIIPKE